MNAAVTIEDVQNNWKVLDSFGLKCDVHFLSPERFGDCGGATVEYVPPGPLLGRLRFIGLFYNALYALKLLLRCRGSSVLLLYGGVSLWLYVGLLNRWVFRNRRRILCWGLFVESDKPLARRVFRSAMQGVTLTALWSKAQIAPHAKHLHVSERRFVFLPYKSNHSKAPSYLIPECSFAFAGGNGKRDYQSLIEAVRDTDVTVVISATDASVRRAIPNLPNVIVLGAPEPAFAQLQAASRFVIVPMKHTGLKGGGEANFCNAMWHGKAVVAADNIAAGEYIIEGRTGYVVRSGDIDGLRERICELWSDPERARAMGTAGREHVIANFTHDAFIRRLLQTACILSASE